MKNDDQTPKTFDVKRGASPPSPTSRPIIVGHHASDNPDPMVHRISVSGHESESEKAEPSEAGEAKEPPVSEVIASKKVIEPLNPPETITPNPEKTEPQKEEGVADKDSEEPIGDAQSPEAAAAQVVQQVETIENPEQYRVHLPAGGATAKKDHSLRILAAFIAIAAGVAAAYFIFSK